MHSWHSLPGDVALAKLGTDPETGLSTAEASERAERLGLNELAHTDRASPLALMARQFRNALVLLLLGAVVLSALVGETVDALIILAIVLASAALGFVQEFRAEKAVHALRRMLAPSATVLRDGGSRSIAARDIVPGDIVLLGAGDKVAADIRLLDVHSLACDESALTGESQAVEKSVAAVEQRCALGDRACMTFAGTAATYGRGRGVVVATGMETQIGRIAGTVSAVETGTTPLERRTAEIGRWIAIFCIGICVLVVVVSAARALLSGSLNADFIVSTLMFAIALAVAAVPEALTAIVTGALALGVQAMAKKNAVVRRLPAVETLGCTTVICTDKTGTLTRGEMTIRRLVVDGHLVEVTGAGYEPVGRVTPAPGLSPDVLETTIRAGVLCNDAELLQSEDGWRIRGDPTEGAFLVLAEKAGLAVAELRGAATRRDENPFSSERKRMTTLHERADGSRAVLMKGAAEVVLPRCSHTMFGGERLALDAEHLARMHAHVESMAGDALRVLAVAERKAAADETELDEDSERDMTLLGLVGMMDPPRAEAREAVQLCRRVGIKPVMITGDHQLTAVAVARELDIYRDGDRIVNGEALASMSVDALTAEVDEITVYTRVSPADKLKIVEAWQSRGEVVAMTGDGVNDAPALRHADIGIAMGISGTDVARESADMVLADDNFATILAAVAEGRRIYDNIKKYLAYLLKSNIAEVVVIGGIVLAMGPEYLPLLPAAILFLNLVTDGPPALALGVSPPDRDVMRRAPRNPRESVFGPEVRTFVLFAVALQCPLYLGVFLYHLDDLTAARGALFFMFVTIEFVIAFNCRSLVQSVFVEPPHRMLVIALAMEVVLVGALVQLPAVRDAFGIAIPPVGELALIGVIGVLFFVAIELVKARLRKRG